MAKKLFKVFFVSCLLFFVFSLAGTVSAANVNCTCSDGTKTVQPDCGACATNCSVSGTTVTACDATGSSCPSGVVCLTNPLGASGISTPQQLIGKVINSVLGVVGSLALIMFIYGGLVWMTSAGNTEKVKKGREIIIWSAIGLFVIFASYALVRFLLANL